MGRFERSKQLARASWGLLRQDKELMLLPLISGLASLVIGASFLVPVFLTARTTNVEGSTTLSMGPLQYVVLFTMYLVLAYIAIYFKTALLCGADERMRGGNPTLGSALSAAGERAGRILPWAVLSATVSVILRSISERSGLLGRIVVGIVGMAWAVVTFLVLPILVFEGVGVGEAVKRSTALLKRTWGENLIVNGGIGLVAMLLSLPALALVGLGALTGTTLGLVTTIVIAGVWMVAVTCWSNAMSGVFQLALYRYAVDGTAPAPSPPPTFPAPSPTAPRAAASPATRPLLSPPRIVRHPPNLAPIQDTHVLDQCQETRGRWGRGGGRGLRGVGRCQGRWLKRVMAASTPSARIISTASAASTTATERVSRSARPGRLSTWSTPCWRPGGLPMPMRILTKSSVCRWALIDLRPLFPASPPPTLILMVPGGRSISSCTTTSWWRSSMP